MQRGLSFNLNKTLQDEEVTLETDREKLFAIISNLIKNALKYTSVGTIEFGYTLQGNMLEFYVKDTGIGIPKNRQEAIFERFVQADIEDTKAMEGAGLGLTIAKLYTEMLGGKIWVESTIDKGTTFYFTLPAKKTLNKLDFENKKATNSNLIISVDKTKKLKILVAEDEKFAFEYLEIILEDISSKVLHAKNGIEAVTITKENTDLDLILMDIKMPHMNGFEATKAIRKFNKKAIIIAQTAFAFPDDRKKALEAGCNEYISKPIVLDKLKEVLAQFF